MIASENRERISPLIDADTLGDFFMPIAAIWHFNFIPRLRPGHFPLTLVAIRSDERKKSRERAHLANAGEFNRRYLTCQISAILYADRRDRLKKASPRYFNWHFSFKPAVLTKLNN